MFCERVEEALLLGLCGWAKKLLGRAMVVKMKFAYRFPVAFYAEISIYIATFIRVCEVL